MPDPIIRTVVSYECARCGRVRDARGDTPFAADYPEGIYLTVRRVTASGNHSISDGELFVCDKDCALGLIQYGISRTTHPHRPIGREDAD